MNSRAEMDSLEFTFCNFPTFSYNYSQTIKGIASTPHLTRNQTRFYDSRTFENYSQMEKVRVYAKIRLAGTLASNLRYTILEYSRIFANRGFCIDRWITLAKYNCSDANAAQSRSLVM